MSQRHIETIVGRLVTDEDFRRRFVAGPDAALEELAALSPRQAAVVESRFFGGFDVRETAALLDISEATVQRDWRAARAWLGQALRDGP